ncbi:MAG: ATP-dependent RNA helicase HrpA, partial [Gammaproteobacteria bacterium]|nr:ATP-dependent RNA helicase HrpA [Gammaproteobacteria bacterium]
MLDKPIEVRTGEPKQENRAAAELDYSGAIDSCMLVDQPLLRRLLGRLQKRAAYGQPHDRLTAQLEKTIARSAALREQRRNVVPTPGFSTDLPVVKARGEIANAIAAHQCIVVCGDTGSGKTTQLPQICLTLGRGVAGFIGHTQPRRVAARSVSQRIADELGAPAAVGFKIRFADTVGEQAHIKLMTDGIALAELNGDPQFLQYDTLIIDEAHERSLNIDFLLGYLQRLLPQRPDLKLIITSATIDPQRLAAHFDGAPVVSVEGRSFPVEIRYREAQARDEDDQDTVGEIADSVDELWRGGPGDVLVFLPGERDIRDAAAGLNKRFPDTDILPLFGRLSSADQQRIFQAHRKRRIVLATNIAETSLTVPGITYVVDTGMERISRYNVSSKVQRLPIEKISQASAIQRAGRCGRLEPGVCVRLYSEADYLARPAFTEAEILRTNLASVILQMRAAKLGDCEDFPFVEAPQSRYINDGYRVLQELGALDEDRRLTNLGRQLARLPVDPRLARIVLAGRRWGCLREMLIIAAALAVQDPRERPLDKAQAADQAHREFSDRRSDFLAFLRLWEAYREQRASLSRNGLRRWCREHFVSPSRMREWLDVHAQLSDACEDMQLHSNRGEAGYAAVHKALLSGFITLVARQDEDGYLGARNRRVHIFPGSGLHKRKPKWLLAAEYAETSRVFARCVAQIEPAWIETVAPHLLKRSQRNPRWDVKRGRVVADEQTSLYGLIVSNRRVVNYAPIDPQLARELFLRHALVRGEFHDPPAFLRDNLALEQEVHGLEEKSRRRDILVDEETRLQHYATRLDTRVHDAASLRKWLRHAAPETVAGLRWSRDDLRQQEPLPDATALFPGHLTVGANRLPLSYRFEPGHREDGVTVSVPLALLHELDPHTGEWLVPGLYLEKVTALIKGLPKQLRKRFVPAPDFARACVESLSASDGLYTGVSRQLQAMTGVECPVQELVAVQLPAHLRLLFRVLDERGDTLAEGRDLGALQQQCNESPAPLDAAGLEREGLRDWDFGELPEYLESVHNGMTVRVYPTLVAEQGGVALRCFASPGRARAALPEGLRELLKHRLHPELRYLRRNIPHLDEMCIWYVRTGSCRQLREDLLDAALVQALLAGRPVPRDREAFEAMLDAGRGALAGVVNELADSACEILQLHHEISNRLSGELPLNRVEAARDIRDQLENLV